jgi:hypothetical protein
VVLPWSYVARGFASQYHHLRYEKGFFYTLHRLEDGAANSEESALNAAAHSEESEQNSPETTAQGGLTDAGKFTLTDEHVNVIGSSDVVTLTRSGDFSSMHAGEIFYTSELVSRTQVGDVCSV